MCQVGETFGKEGAETEVMRENRERGTREDRDPGCHIEPTSAFGDVKLCQVLGDSAFRNEDEVSGTADSRCKL